MQSTSCVDRVELWQPSIPFMAHKPPDDVNIPEHIADMHQQQNKLHQMGCKIDDEEFKAVLVMSLPQSWDHFISSYQGTHLKPDKEDDHGITSQELTSVLIDEYQCHLDSGIVPENWSCVFYAQPSTGNKKKKGGDY